MEANRLGQPSRSDLAALETLRTRLMSLWRPLNALELEFHHNRKAANSWPALRDIIHQITDQITSIQTLLYDDPQTTSLIAKFHPYPAPPFEFERPDYASATDALVRKKPELDEEKWIADRLAKAHEFAHVPAEWGLEAQMLPEEENADEGEGAEGSVAKRFRRKRAFLGEDQLAEIWADASRLASDELIKVTEAEAHQRMGEESGEEESEEEEEEDMAMGGVEGGKEGGMEKKVEAKAPLMPLEVVLKFMCTGMVERPRAEEQVV